MVVLIGIGAQASTLAEEKRFVINRINANDFEVIKLRGMGAHEFWCAAANYIEVRTGQSERTRIYVRTPLGASVTQSGAKGVVFSTSDAGLPPESDRLNLTVSEPGVVLKSALARRYCRDAFTRSTK